MDHTTAISGEDAEMNDAIASARATLRQFLDAFFQPKANQTSFLLKVRFTDGSSVEHIWLADLQLTDEPPTGIVANEPSLASLNFMERIPFDPREVSDWMFMEDGLLVGGFTTKLLKPAARPS